MTTASNLIPLHLPQNTSGVLSGAQRSIGDILVANGRISREDAARVMERQSKDKLKFGEAAIAMKLLTKEDIDMALSNQFEYVYLQDQDTSLDPELVAAYKPFSRVGENIRAVRSQLMLRWFNTDPGRKMLAVVSPNTGEGRSFVAANIAVVFAQQGERTLLIDGDLRTARQQTLFRMTKSAGLSGILAGRAGLEAAHPVPSLPGLSVLPAGATPPNPQELLGRAAFGNMLQLASQQFDVIIIDTPAGNKFADAEIVSARAGAALMVARKGKSSMSDAGKLARRLQDGGVALIGSILNDD